jgi:hypothetical protein
LPLFTDFTYDNIGVPRNRNIPANADAGYFDLGLCGPCAPICLDAKSFCGAFKVPTLRNVALTAPYLHNGRSLHCRKSSTSMSPAIPILRSGMALQAIRTPGIRRPAEPLCPPTINTKEVPYTASGRCAGLESQRDRRRRCIPANADRRLPAVTRPATEAHLI